VRGDRGACACDGAGVGLRLDELGVDERGSGAKSGPGAGQRAQPRRRECTRAQPRCGERTGAWPKRRRARGHRKKRAEGGSALLLSGPVAPLHAFALSMVFGPVAHAASPAA
jgi:hypothetical protein